jgi:hypothetical protein
MGIYKEVILIAGIGIIASAASLPTIKVFSPILKLV